MRYYMIADDGTKYGPADLPILNQWIVEGRVGPLSTLQEVATARYVRADTVPGLAFHAPMAQMPPPPGNPYQNAPASPVAYPRPGAQGNLAQFHEADRI